MLRMFHKGRQLFAGLVEVYKKDLRRHTRLPAKFSGTMSGPFGTIECTGIDLNRDGAGVQSRRDLPEGTLIFLRIAELGVAGFGHVRHCTSRGEGYFLGLEFREHLARERGEDASWEYHRAMSTSRNWDASDF